MDSQIVKRLGYLAFAGGVASIVGSSLLVLVGQRQRSEPRQQTGLFVGLWAPTLFAIAELLDRIAEEDREYLGITLQPHPEVSREPFLTPAD
ncbi:MAG: hypothetical protein VKP72_08205 [bacterium]|nr:hypothetical protein [bacterium]